MGVVVADCVVRPLSGEVSGDFSVTALSSELVEKCMTASSAKQEFSFCVEAANFQLASF